MIIILQNLHLFSIIGVGGMAWNSNFSIPTSFQHPSCCRSLFSISFFFSPSTKSGLEEWLENLFSLYPQYISVQASVVSPFSFSFSFVDYCFIYWFDFLWGPPILHWIFCHWCCLNSVDGKSTILKLSDKKVSKNL